MRQRRSQAQHPFPPPTPAVDCCPLCERPLPAGPSVDEHHWVPRSEGGKAKTRLHRICHQKIHATFSERELALYYHTPERLRAHPEIARFVTWLMRRPIDYLDRSRRPRRNRTRNQPL